MKNVYIVEKLFEIKKRELMRSPEAWEEYLETAGKHDRYDFADALLIEAQNRDATAIADAALWEKRMGRKLKDDARGIAVIRALTYHYCFVQSALLESVRHVLLADSSF